MPTRTATADTSSPQLERPPPIPVGVGVPEFTLIAESSVRRDLTLLRLHARISKRKNDPGRRNRTAWVVVFCLLGATRFLHLKEGATVFGFLLWRPAQRELGTEVMNGGEATARSAVTIVFWDRRIGVRFVANVDQ